MGQFATAAPSSSQQRRTWHETALPPSQWQAGTAFELTEPGFPLPQNDPAVSTRGATPLDRLLSLIASAEAPRGQYDAVHHRAAIAPPAPPTQMTLAQIFRWIGQTPGQFHAIGRYQFIPETLQRLVRENRIETGTRFSPQLQDSLARRLIDEAGYPEFLAGTLPPATLMDSLARIWAGLPLGNGLSAYHGHAGNRATITRSQYQSAFASIFGR